MRTLWLLALTGCGPCFYQQLVHVTDENGAPIEGAQVSAVAASINSAPTPTNSAGLAPLPSTGILTTLWVSIAADGFAPERIDFPSDWPLRVRLRRSPQR